MPDPPTDLAGLRAGAGFLAAVLEAEPIRVAGANGGLRFAGPAAVAVLGYDSARELLGRRIPETLHRRRPDGTP